VNAITSFDNKVFVAGLFSVAGGVNVYNIAYWDGTNWNYANCLYGTVYDLVVFNGNLYAAGSFDVCASLSDVNFARWTGSGWQQIPGLSGRINTMEVKNSSLYLGGAFIYNNNPTNAIKWDATNGFQTFSNPIRNEVNDFEIYNDTVYAVCTRTTNDTFVFRKLFNNTWDSSYYYSMYKSSAPSKGPMSLKTLCAHADTFMMGGDFAIPNIMGTNIENALAVTPYSY
jgi:hypothetical protein